MLNEEDVLGETAENSSQQDSGEQAPADVTQAPGKGQDSQASVTDFRPSGAEKRIRQLLARSKQSENENKQLKTQLDNVTKMIDDLDKSPASVGKGKENGELLTRLAVLEKKLADKESDEKIDSQITDFRKLHPEIDDADMAIIEPVVYGYNFVDDKSGKYDWEKGLKTYKAILSKKAIVKPEPSTSDVRTLLGGSTAGKPSGKNPLSMSEDELKAEFFKTLPA
jgi:hypothetical protein